MDSHLLQAALEPMSTFDGYDARTLAEGELVESHEDRQ